MSFFSKSRTPAGSSSPGNGHHSGSWRKHLTESASLPLANPRDLRILVVDPDPITRRSLRLTAESIGYQIIEAETGVGAVRETENQRIDLVLGASRLPDMTGYNMLRRLRRHSLSLDVPVVLFSEDIEQLFKARGLRVGRTGFLVKPFHPAHLLESLHFYLHTKYELRIASSEKKVWLFDQPVPTAALSRHRGQHILVVEDPALEREHVATRLRNQGLPIETAMNGLDAFLDVRRLLPAAVVSEILTPGYDGYELCLALRQLSADIPVILTSGGFGDEADWRVAQSVGASAFVLREDRVDPILEALQARGPSISRQSHSA